MRRKASRKSSIFNTLFYLPNSNKKKNILFSEKNKNLRKIQNVWIRIQRFSISLLNSIKENWFSNRIYIFFWFMCGWIFPTTQFCLFVVAVKVALKRFLLLILIHGIKLHKRLKYEFNWDQSALRMGRGWWEFRLTVPRFCVTVRIEIFKN